MSPRRMDISSLLRDPSPPRHPPPSLLSLLNTPPPPPFLGLDALVHVASEERRRIYNDSPQAPDPLSPRYGHVYRMAGGIQVLSNDPTSQSPSRDSHRPLERPFSLDHDRRHVVAHLDDQQTPFHRDRVRPPPSHFPPMDIAKCTGIPDPDFSSQPPRHPIRVWEEQPATRRISPTRIPSFVSGLTEFPTRLAAPESGNVNDHVVEHVPALSACKQPPQSHGQPLPSGLKTPLCPDPQPLLPSPTHHWLPTQSEPQPHLPQTPLLTSPRASTSPILSLHLQNFETQSQLHPHPQVGARTIIPFPPSVPEPAFNKAELMTGVVDTTATGPCSSKSSPELVQRVLALESVTCGMSTDANISQSPSTDTSHHLPIIVSAKSERNLPAEDIPTPPLAQPEPPSRRTPELEYTAEQGLSQQAMMDVDEELLSLVEDRSVRVAPEIPKPQIDLTSPLPVTVTGAGGEWSLNTASDSPSSLIPPTQPVLKALPDEEKDRASMPPPAARKKPEKDKTTLASSTGTGSKRKKDGALKSTAKPKQPPKLRAKPKPKPSAADTSSKAGIARGALNADARSRSTSVIPSAADDVIPEPEEHESDKEDDKLYCVCKTRYDEDRVMIACDRCDEWFHTLCANMPDQEIDLVDQFICSPCIQKHPHLRTTWKQRCLFGLQDDDPSSPRACHKPSRGAFSKYCSDDCGIKYMQARIAQWEKSGGDRDLLWESVKNAAKREGVVVRAVTNGADPTIVDIGGNDVEHKLRDSAAKRRAEREVARLNARLEEVVKARELMKRELDMVMWREKVVELASERAGKVDECGWDQRLCFGEEEWADFGSEVLESYEEERVKVEPGDDATPLDAVSATHGEWWCTGKKKCDRHAGWQKLRVAEVSFDKETKEGVLLKLTASEREIRKSIEDILYPQPVGALQVPPYPEIQLNGSKKPLASHVHTSERGKKRLS